MLLLATLPCDEPPVQAVLLTDERRNFSGSFIPREFGLINPTWGSEVFLVSQEVNAHPSVTRLDCSHTPLVLHVHPSFLPLVHQPRAHGWRWWGKIFLCNKVSFHTGNFKPTNHPASPPQPTKSPKRDFLKAKRSQKSFFYPKHFLCTEGTTTLKYTNEKAPVQAPRREDEEIVSW